MKPTEYSLDRLLEQTVTTARNSVRTQYACQVLAVSEDGRFVDVAHNTLEWRDCPNGETVMYNSYNQAVLCSPTKPWIIQDVPVEEVYERGQWKVRVRPKVGDRGILSVFYHDINSLKEKGGFQAPDAIRIMAIDSASFRPGLPNHADVNAETEPYPSDDEWELKGNGVNVKFTSPVDDDSESPNKIEVNVGTVNFTITVPKDGDPTVVFDAPNGAVTLNTKTAVVNASTSVKIDTPSTTITGDLSVGGNTSLTGAVTAGATITATGEITGNGIALSTHTHLAPAAAALTPPPAPTPATGVPIQ